MTRHDVFISYNSRDKDAALSIYNQLRTRGYRPWIDVHDSRPGQRWLDPLEIFEEGAAQLGGTLAEALAGDDPLALSRLLEPLLRFSLVERDVEARTVSVHRMVQAAVRDGLDERSWAERVVRVLAGIYPTSYKLYSDISTWPLCDRLEAHVRVAEDLIERLSIEEEAVADLLPPVGVYAARRGRLAAGASRIERSLRMSEKLHGSEHASVASAYHELAIVLHDQGDLDGARKNLERSLEIKASVFGTQEHPDVAASLHQLAIVLQAQGDLDGARKNLERVLEIDTKVYGTRDHYETAITERNLGYLLRTLDEPEAAQELLEHAYQVFLSLLGPEHRYTRRLGGELGKIPPNPPSSKGGA